MDPKWLQWAKALQTMSQVGLTYAKDPYDIARYEALREIAFEMMATYAQTDITHVRNFFQDERGHATPKVDVGVRVRTARKATLRIFECDRGTTGVPSWDLC